MSLATKLSLQTHDKFGCVPQREFDETVCDMSRTELVELCKALNHRLQQVAIELENREEAVGELFDGLAHDLKAPWRAISGFTGYLKEEFGDQLDETAHSYADQIVGGMDRMSNQFRGLSQVARVATRKTRFQNVCLNSILANTLHKLGNRLSQSRNCVSSDQLPTVYGDGELLQVLLENLISNSIEFATDREPQIHISILDSLNEHVVMVSDRGTGMEETEIEKAFRPFRSRGFQTCKHRPGTGLTVCRKIIEQHKGKIWIEPNRGPGITVKFTIPKQGTTGSLAHDICYTCTSESGPSK